MTSSENPSNDELFSEIYEELRSLIRRSNPGRAAITWNPTALVNEAYLKLSRSKAFRATSKDHLKYTAIRAVKYILIEAARRQTTERRGGGSVPIATVPLDENVGSDAAIDPHELLAVAFALDELAAQSELQARVFEYQFFGGLEVAEIGELLGISEKKVQRTLRIARAALTVSLSRGRVQ